MVMRRNGVLIALALAAGSAGCSSFLEATARNLTELPVQSCDEIKLARRNRRRAEDAWAQVRESFSEQCWTPDYVAGFKDGYADYLDNGGNGEPPATPPFRYRLRPYQTPDGLRAIDEWYAGFRHGSSLALASGYRETVVIPLSSPPINAVERYPNANPSVAPPALVPPTVPPVALPPAVPPEALNPPRKVSWKK